MTSQKNNAMPKTLARIMAVQAIYAKNLTPSEDSGIPENNEALIELCKAAIPEAKNIKPDKKFFRKIVEKSVSEQEKINEIINKFLEDNWSIERLGVMLYSLLQVATCELLTQPKTPKRVVINEYTTISRLFFDESDGRETSFVNAILDKVASSLESE